MISDHDFSGNYPVVVAQKMAFEALKEMFWAPFAKFDTPKEAPVSKNNRPRPTNAVIVMHWELTRKPGDMIEVPLHRQLVSLPRTGKKQLSGLEELPKINHAQVAITVQRHAERPQDSTMDTHVLKEYDLINNSRHALQSHFARSEETLGVSYAMYYGYSWNIFDSGMFDNETKISANSHPHVYIAGQGKVAYTSYPGTSGWETKIGTQLGSVGPSHVLDTGFLQALKADPQIRKIPAIVMYNGNPLRLLVAHPWQIVTLENDDRFNQVVSRAMVQEMAKANPFLIGAKYIYAGFAIFENDTAVWPVRVTGGVPVWGPATIVDLTSFEDYSSDTMFAGMVLGSNAIMKAMGTPMRFLKEMEDYGEVLGVAYRIVQGYARNQFWNRDDGSTGQYQKCDSSAIIVTYAGPPAF